MNFHTLAARGGRDVPSASRPLTAPIYQTNVYVFEDMETVESVWEGKSAGYVYGRYGGTSAAMMLHRMISEAFHWRGEFQVCESLQMCAADRTSQTDLEEAYACGRQGYCVREIFVEIITIRPPIIRKRL